MDFEFLELRFGEHRPLPARRAGYTQTATIGAHTIIVRTSEYTNGTLGEIDIDITRKDSGFRALLRAVARSVSLGLQHGVPLATYVDEFTFTRFDPAGTVAGNDCINRCTSILDYVFRELAVSYLGRFDLAQVDPTGVPIDSVDDDRLAVLLPVGGLTRQRIPTSVLTTTDSPETVEKPPLDEITKARMRGYEGEPCGDCGAYTIVRNGTCRKCNSCGMTTGCGE